MKQDDSEAGNGSTESISHLLTQTPFVFRDWAAEVFLERQEEESVVLSW